MKIKDRSSLQLPPPFPGLTHFYIEASNGIRYATSARREHVPAAASSGRAGQLGTLLTSSTVILPSVI